MHAGLHRDVAHVPRQARARTGAAFLGMAVALHMKHQEPHLRSMAPFCALHDEGSRQQGPCKGLVKFFRCHGFCQIAS